MSFETIEFANPIILGDGKAEATAESTEVDDTSLEESVTPNDESVKEVNTDDVEPTEGTESTDASTEGDDKWSLTDDAAPDLLNTLANLGYLTELPEGVDPEDINAESAQSILKFRDTQLINKAQKEASEFERKRIISKLSPSLQKAMVYNINNPNAEDNEIVTFLGGLSNVNRITSLDVEKDAELIVREFYKTQGYEAESINEKVSDLIELNKLSKEATLVKPKLDVKAQAIVQRQEDEARQIQDFEAKRQTALHTSTVDLLNKGSIEGVPLTRETQGFVYNAIMNNEVPVTVKGRQVEMGALEALIMKNKYSNDEDSLKRVAFAAIILKDGVEGLTKHLGKKVITKETEKAVKQFKFTNRKKTSTKVSKEDEGGAFQIKF